MHELRVSPFRAALRVGLMLLVAATPALAEGTIEGRWRLVEQSYGTGAGDLIRAQAPLYLGFEPSSGELKGRVWTEGGGQAGVPWPVLLVEGRPLEPRVQSVEFGAARDRVRARYEIDRPEDPGAVLEISEEYHVDTSGTVLEGTVTVRLMRAGREAGHYTLRRRLERMR